METQGSWPSMPENLPIHYINVLQSTQNKKKKEKEKKSY